MQDIRLRRLDVAQYHPRVHRPCSPRFPYQIATYPKIIEKSAVAVEILIQRMHHLFHVIEPDPDNLRAYGHEIRNLLLLGCMEVEAAWAAILRANSYPGDRWTTKDYIKLIGPLHLPKYELKVTSYAGVPTLSPFAKWNDTQPTQSLKWYHAYNQTKHDREVAFHVATLSDAIDAVAAAVILFYAQFGQTYCEDDLFEIKLRFRDFHVTKWPTFPAEEWYVIQELGTWVPVNLSL
jgi:hypothetical protein